MNRLLLPCLLACSLLAGIFSVRAQPIDTEPEFVNAFPWEERREGVGMKYPVLISPNVIIPSGAILRVMYVPLKADDAEVQAEKSRPNMEKAFTRKKDDPTVVLSPRQIAQQRIQRETVWPNIKTFQVAMGQLNADDMHLVYLRPDKVELVDETFNLPQGLLLGEDGGVKVMAVQKKTGAAAAGFKAGDVITKVGETSVSTLEQFSAAYRVAKDSAGSSRKMPMTVHTSAGEQVKTIKLPMGLEGSIMDM